MNQTELYVTLMGIPAFILQMAFIVGGAVAVLTDSAELGRRLIKTLAVMLIIVVLWETSIITYVSIIKLID